METGKVVSIHYQGKPLATAYETLDAACAAGAYLRRYGYIARVEQREDGRYVIASITERKFYA